MTDARALDADAWLARMALPELPDPTGGKPWKPKPFLADVGGHLWRDDRGPYSLCHRPACRLPYAKWTGDRCPAVGIPLGDPPPKPLVDGPWQRCDRCCWDTVRPEEFDGPCTMTWEGAPCGGAFATDPDASQQVASVSVGRSWTPSRLPTRTTRTTTPNGDLDDH